MSAIFRKMRVTQNEGQVSIHMAGIEGVDELQELSQEEKELLSMSSRDRVKLFKERVEGYKLPELRVTHHPVHHKKEGIVLIIRKILTCNMYHDTTF